MLAGDDDGDSAQQGARTLAAPVSPTLVIAGGLVLLAAWQIIRGHTLPPAVTLTWYASRLVQPLIGNIMKG
jgi:hypothetical protein